MGPPRECDQRPVLRAVDQRRSDSYQPVTPIGGWAQHQVVLFATVSMACFRSPALSSGRSVPITMAGHAMAMAVHELPPQSGAEWPPSPAAAPARQAKLLAPAFSPTVAEPAHRQHRLDLHGGGEVAHHSSGVLRQSPSESVWRVRCCWTSPTDRCRDRRLKRRLHRPGDGQRAITTICSISVVSRQFPRAHLQDQFLLHCVGG